MIVQINTGKTLNADYQKQEYYTTQVKKSLKRHESKITRIEVHIKDENGNNDGIGDLSCTMEVRLKDRQPIAVTCEADTMALALDGAIEKIKNSIETILGKSQNY
jgi:ribosome-associated translation inhibitor RaiA